MHFWLFLAVEGGSEEDGLEGEEEGEGEVEGEGSLSNHSAIEYALPEPPLKRAKVRRKKRLMQIFEEQKCCKIFHYLTEDSRAYS